MKSFEKLAKLLKDQGADLRIMDNCLRTPLSWAARRGRERIVNLLLNSRVGQEVLNTLDADQKSPLRCAIDGRHGWTAWLLIIHGAAAQPPCEDTGKLLDDCGIIDLEAKSPMGLGGMMIIAVGNRHLDFAERLLDKGACVDGPVGSGGTFLTENEDESMVQLLVARGADVDPRNTLGKTPLRIALDRDQLTIARHLFEKGASSDKAGITDDEMSLLVG